MKSQNFQTMTDAELATKLASLKQELFNLRFSHATGQLENPKKITNCKRDIARVMTIIRTREIRNDKVAK